MNNEPMYDTFVKNRAQDDPKSSPLSGSDLPDIEFDLDEPGENRAPSYSEGQAMGVDRSMGSLQDFLRHEKNDDAPSLSDLEAAVLAGAAAEAAEEAAAGYYREPFEFKDGCVSLPNPDVFNSYPPEVQRKIMEWTDRDIKARRDDESRRQDAILRAEIAHERTKTAIPVSIIILSIACALITGIYTKSAIFTIAFLVVAIAVIIAMAMGKFQQGKDGSTRPPHH